MDFDGTPLVFRSDALGRGFTDHELRAARRSRELLAVRPGAYVRAADLARLDSVAQHRLAVLAAASSCPDAVVSHVSAAVLHGIAVWAVPLRRVHSTLDRASGGKITTRRHVHVARCPPRTSSSWTVCRSQRPPERSSTSRGRRRSRARWCRVTTRSPPDW
ncbi:MULTISPECIES: hypothetical protein [unclassified Rhodococcus (in: high G+C Gram-positive bacteria)]|uniref:hypothetical protein n=1 Tax=unclassified Rhodococcus (in: high G+C Gram-positive bacteria) TaxID=192944 RepID=UPI000E0AE5E3|nr:MULTISPECIES: hypothetical protein [unclassified Rhodococcus (in: high G+C Gram-positive bacteria)]